MGSDQFLIVGIGASAGGIQAIRRFFEQVQADSGNAYVVVLHLSPEHESHLAEVLQLSSPVPVTQVLERVKVEPNHVYVISPDRSLSLVDDHLTVTDITRFEERRAPVDIFFRTLADARGPLAVCVVLSGTGANGSMGMKRVKEKGGICFVQDPEEAEFSDMPRNSIAKAIVDHVLPVAEIPARIQAYRASLETMRLPETTAGPPPPSDEAALREIFSLLRLRTGHDFSYYKRGTVLRRLARRMSLRDAVDLPAYGRFVRDHPDESHALLRDLLISVTNFFRDRDAFDALERVVIPRLFEGKGEDDQVRVWVPACATGEEAYSVAMLLAEQSSAGPGSPAVQVFASDLDEGAIATAREGLYTLNDAADVSPERLRRFFTRDGDGYRVRKELREMILFAQHNLSKDPPFSHLDLVSCRNLLIYLNRAAQQRVMQILHFALNAGGYLFLGSSESIEGASDLFVEVDHEAFLYQSRAVAIRPGLPMPDLLAPRFDSHGHEERPAEQRARDRLSAVELHQRLLEQYAPPSVVVNAEHEIVHLSERAGRYLQYTAGEPSHNLLRVVRPELRLDLRTALYQAAQQKTAVEAPGLEVPFGDRTALVTIVVRPVVKGTDTARGFFLVVFKEEAETGEAPPETAAPVERTDATRQLEDELARAKNQLRATIERHETQAEELKASNEELQAMNEELRSSAEELETGKEELQSLNEELRTVNQELKITVEEQAQARDDTENLINSTEIGTIFLDRASRIKLFTPKARDLFTLIPTDLGRPLSDISSRLHNVDLTADIARVLARLERVEREVRTTDGHWHLMRTLPYRTAEDHIDGVVLTFVDITPLKLAEEALRASEERLRRAIAIDTVGVSFFQTDGMVTDANDAFLAMTGYSRGDLDLHRVRWDALTPLEYQPQARAALGQLVQLGHSEPHEKEMIRKDGSRCLALVTATRLSDHEGVEFAVDLTSRTRTEEQLRRSENRLRLVVESVTDYAILTMDADGNIDTWNPGAASMFGYREGEILGQPVGILFTAEDRGRGTPADEMRRADLEGRASDERWHLRQDGSRFFASGVIAPLRTAGGAITGFVKIARDLTERKRWEDALQQAHDELEQRVRQRTAELGDANRALDAELTERRRAEEQIRGLMRRLITVQEDERRRIARDLHDHLGQQVSGLRLKIDALNQVARRNAALRARVEDAQQTIARLDRDLDFFTWVMRPAALDDLGLVVTLRNFVQEWSREFSIPAEFQSRGLDGVRLAYEVETNLHRITQEALNNIYKHARARRAAIILERRGPQLVLVIEDDGIGFDRAERVSADDKGIGLLGMEERTAILGGSLEIESSTSTGTTIFVRIPLGE